MQKTHKNIRKMKSILGMPIVYSGGVCKGENIKYIYPFRASIQYQIKVPLSVGRKKTVLK